MGAGCHDWYHEGDKEIMNIVGIMCVKDEADLLPEVLDHFDGELDTVYAYEDGSIDDTYKILKSHPNVGYIKRKKNDTERLDIMRPNYHHLLERIKQDYEGEEVWVVSAEGDRFFLNKKPRQIVEEAEAGGYVTVHGTQLDFVRHRSDPWTEENDTWPEYGSSLREICKWFLWDENCVVAWKLSPERSYLESKYPWPRGGHTKEQYRLDGRWTGKLSGGELTIDRPFLEHQGRRSPNAFKWRIDNGSRPLSRKINMPVVSFETIMDLKGLTYHSWKCLPWVDNSSLIQFVEMYNNPDFIYNKVMRTYYEPVMEDIEANGPHRRKDI